jgi:hypothetical protein
MVTVLVGPSAQKFLIHKERVCHHSQVLKAAFNGNFIEGQTQTYRIEDTSPGGFRIFTRWIYDQDLDLFQLKSKEEKRRDVRLHIINLVHFEDMELGELWVLADKMAIHRLQNFIVRKIVQTREMYGSVTVRTLLYICERTAVGSPLRRLMVSEVAQNCRKNDDFDCTEYFPHEFLMDLAKHQIRYVPAGKPQQQPDVSNFFVYVLDEDILNQRLLIVGLCSLFRANFGPH